MGGPLRISKKHGYLLDGVDNADSVSISGHKWIFQPKDSSILLFKNTSEAHESISVSRVLIKFKYWHHGIKRCYWTPLLATLMTWGKRGLAERLDSCMTLSTKLYSHLLNSNVLVFSPPVSGVILWRPKAQYSADEIFSRLPLGSASLTTVNDEKWVRHVAANPNMQIDLLCSKITEALEMLG